MKLARADFCPVIERVVYGSRRGAIEIVAE